MHLKNVHKTSKILLIMLQKHSCQCTVRLQYRIHITDAWESSSLLLQLIKAKVIIISLCTVVKFNVLYHTISLYHYLYLVGTDVAISAWPVISKNRHQLKHTKVKTIYFIHSNKGCLFLHTCIHHLNHCHLIATADQFFWKLTWLQATGIYTFCYVHVQLTRTNEPVLLMQD